MNHRVAADGIFLAHFRADLAHLGNRHRLVGLIFQVLRGTAAGVVAYDAFEDRDGSVVPEPWELV